MPDFLIPLHPKLVHFPIAFIVGALLLEIVSQVSRKSLLHQAAVVLYAMAALFSIPTVLAGQAEQQRLHLHHPLLEAHEMYALIFMYSSLAGLLILGLLHKCRPAWVRPVFVGLVCLLTASALAASWYGGQMVYDYGVGVKP